MSVYFYKPEYNFNITHHAFLCAACMKPLSSLERAGDLYLPTRYPRMLSTICNMRATASVGCACVTCTACMCDATCTACVTCTACGVNC